MRNRTMTLHWAFHETLRETHPELDVEQQLFVIDDGRVTCAGGTAPVDMMNAILTVQHGPEFALKISDWFSCTNVRVAESAQRSGIAQRYRMTNVDVTTTIELMESHIDDPLDLQQLSSMSTVSERQLNRLFQQHLGVGTMGFYRQLRLQRSHQLLTQSTLSIAGIGAATGFNNSAHFSRSFKDLYKRTPSEVRHACQSVTPRNGLSKR